MKLSYPDTVILVDPVINDYGSEKIGRQETVKAIVGQVTGYARGANQAQITADSIAYLDPSNSFVLQVVQRLEGMLVITSLGEDSTDAWYRIETVNVGRRSLTCNDIDNIQVNLKKTSPIGTIS